MSNELESLRARVAELEEELAKAGQKLAEHEAFCQRVVDLLATPEHWDSPEDLHRVSQLLRKEWARALRIEAEVEARRAKLKDDP